MAGSDPLSRWSPLPLVGEFLPTNLHTENGSYSLFQRLGSPRREHKSLIIRVCLDCHGRGREFESRRPRHSFQKSYSDFTETNEGAKGHVLAPFFAPLLINWSHFHVRDSHGLAALSFATEFVSKAKTNPMTAARAGLSLTISWNLFFVLRLATRSCQPPTALLTSEALITSSFNR
jgi:hypothetical protein